MRSSMVLVLALGLAGCATSGRTTAQRFTGYPYDVHDEGNRVSGLVCGVNVDYSVDHARRRDGRQRLRRALGLYGGARPGRRAPRHRLARRRPDRGELDLVVDARPAAGARRHARRRPRRRSDDTYRGRYTVRNQPGAAPMIDRGARRAVEAAAGRARRAHAGDAQLRRARRASGHVGAGGDPLRRAAGLRDARGQRPALTGAAMPDRVRRRDAGPCRAPSARPCAGSRRCSAGRATPCGGARSR